MVAGPRGSSDSSVVTLGKSFWAGKLPVDFGVEMPTPRLLHDLRDFRRVQEASVPCEFTACCQPSLAARAPAILQCCLTG